VQPHVDAIKAALGGVPASQIVINLSDDGQVQTVEPKITFRRKTAVDKGGGSCKS
jgi:hypothetical protein